MSACKVACMIYAQCLELSVIYLFYSSIYLFIWSPESGGKMFFFVIWKAFPHLEELLSWCGRSSNQRINNLLTFRHRLTRRLWRVFFFFLLCVHLSLVAMNEKEIKKNTFLQLLRFWPCHVILRLPVLFGLLFVSNYYVLILTNIQMQMWRWRGSSWGRNL